MNTSPSFSASDRRGYLLALPSAALAALAFVVGKWTLQFVTPVLLNAFMTTLAGMLLTLDRFRPARSNRELASATAWKWVVLFAASSFMAVLLLWSGIQRMDPSLASFLNRSEVIISVTLAILFLGERFNRGELMGVLLSIAGLAVMRMTLRVDYSAGFWLVLGGAMFFGVTEFVAKNAVRHVSITFLTWMRSLMMAAGFWILFLLRGETFQGLDVAWPGLVAVTLLAPVSARLIYLSALRLIPLSRAAVINQAQPAFVLAFALLLLGQLPTLRETAGGALVVAGCVLMVVARRSVREDQPGA